MATVRKNGIPKLSSVERVRLVFRVLVFCFYSSLPFDFSAFSAESYAGQACIETTGTAIVSRLTTQGVQIPLDCYTAPVSVMLAGDGRFKIQLFNHHLYTKRQIIFSFDGTNYFYLISKSGSNIPSPTTSTSKLANTTEAKCYISAEEMPLIIFDDPARDALWYAVCSGAFFRKHGQSGEILQLFQSPRRSVMGYGYRYETSLTNTFFNLPHKLNIWRDKKLDKKDKGEEENRIELDAVGQGGSIYDTQWAAKSFIPDGSHVLELLWKSDFLLQNQRLPLKIEITTFYPAQTNPPPLFSIRLEFEPWRVSTDEKQTFRPPDPLEPTRVRDARVRVREGTHYVDEIHYMLGTNPTNSAWLSTADRWFKQGILAALDAQTTTTPGPKRRSLVFFLLMIPLVLVPLSFLCYAYRKGKRTIVSGN